MRQFEYKAIPAPTSGTKARGVKSREDRFALSMTGVLNEMAAEGWEYLRAEMLPMEERKGLTGTQTHYQNVLIFRRLQGAALTLEEGPQVKSLAAPERADDAPETAEVKPVLRPVSDDGKAPPLGAATE